MGVLGRYCKLAELIEIKASDLQSKCLSRILTNAAAWNNFLLFQFMADEWKYSTCTQINREKKGDSKAAAWADHYLCRALEKFLRKKRENKANGITFIAGVFLLNGRLWPANLLAFQNICSGNTLSLSGPQ